jgi:hypothetical protein
VTSAMTPLALQKEETFFDSQGPPQSNSGMRLPPSRKMQSGHPGHICLSQFSLRRTTQSNGIRSAHHTNWRKAPRLKKVLPVLKTVWMQMQVEVAEQCGVSHFISINSLTFAGGCEAVSREAHTPQVDRNLRDSDQGGAIGPRNGDAHQDP